MLVEFLDYLRESMILKTEGISEEDAKRPMVPSGTSLLGLVKHLAMVERWWFHVVFAAEAEDVPDENVTADDTVADVVASYRAITIRSNEIVAACGNLDQPAATVPKDREPPTLRWVLVHMVEETGRHAGHADILRELIDGSTGR